MALPSPPQRLHVVSWNVKGLGSAEKRSAILRELRRLHASICFLQETHFRQAAIPRFYNLSYPTAIHHGSPDSKSRGVSILIQRSLHWRLVDEWRDEEGRILMVKGFLDSQMYTLATLYAPNSAQLTSIGRWLEQIHQFTEGTLLLGGDFNMVLDPSLDISKSAPRTSYSKVRCLRKHLQQYQLMDVWRVLHPRDRDYTFYSHPHQGYSRIDWFLVGHVDLPKIRSASIGSITLSDHAPILLEVEISPSGGKPWTWKLNDSLLQNPQVMSDVQTELVNFFAENVTVDSNPLMVWEAHKAYIRGVLIKHGSRIKKDREEKTRYLLAEIGRLETLHKQSHALAALGELNVLREQLKSVYSHKIKAQAVRCRSRYYRQANKSGKLLAKALREQRAQTFIPEIRDPAGTLRFLTQDIADAFKNYYSTLYNLRPPVSASGVAQMQERIRSYLVRAALPELSSETVSALDAPITVEEFTDAVDQAKTGKAPGPDGFSIGYYKSVHLLLAQHFLKAFNLAGQGVALPVDTLRAYITLIPKEDKDLTLCSSYRPISLLNIDLKLFTKILANRISPLLPDLIHFDQVGFVPGREARDNTSRVIALIHAAVKKGSSMVLLSTDAEKAFDRVDWTFMIEVLKMMGMGEGMLSWLKAIYSVPSACVRVNGQLSDSFGITNGTRQGCPLSPLLFALILEPFLRIVRFSRDITGLQVGRSGEHKIAAYADDLLFFLTCPHIALPCLLVEFRLFGELSNFKINVSKSEALNVSVPETTQRLLAQNFPFRWSTSTINYLGIKISRDPSHLFLANFPPFLQCLKQDISRWQKGLLSWLGRSNVIKMNILPRILYLLQAIPIRIPRVFLQSVRSTIHRFLWAGKPPRLASSILYLSKEEGGIALPDIFRYYAAVHLSRVVDWCRQSPYRQWIMVEQQASPVPLSTLPWCTGDLPADIKTHPTISASLSVCKDQFPHRKISPSPSPLYSISGNPEFPPGVENTRFCSVHLEGHLRVYHLIQMPTWPTMEGMLTHPRLRDLTYWQRRQLSHFLRTLPELDQFRRPLTGFEEVCMGIGDPRHLISKIYSALICPPLGFRPLYIQAWERELGVSWTPEQMHLIMERAHSSSICIRYQESSYKLLSRWYQTPQRLHHIFPGTPDTCWRCNQAVGTLLHMFWECPVLGSYWQNIARMVRKFTDFEVVNDPAFFLLHLTSSTTSRYKKSVLPHLLNAAKSLIPMLWKTTSPPTLQQWILRVGEIYRMEERLAVDLGSQASFALRWVHWQEFCNTTEYASILGGGGILWDDTAALEF